MLKSNEAYRLVYREYPDVVNVEQMCEMLIDISTELDIVYEFVE